MTTVYVPVKRQAAQRANTVTAPQPLAVDDLRTGVALFARLAKFVESDDDAEAVLGELKQALAGDEAEAQLKRRLQQVYGLLERTVSTCEAVEPETPGEKDDQPPRAQRVLRPFKSAARACATQARRLVGSARQAKRRWREARAARHAPAPDQ